VILKKKDATLCDMIRKVVAAPARRPVFDESSFPYRRTAEGGGGCVGRHMGVHLEDEKATPKGSAISVEREKGVILN